VIEVIRGVEQEGRLLPFDLESRSLVGRVWWGIGSGGYRGLCVIRGIGCRLAVGKPGRLHVARQPFSSRCKSVMMTHRNALISLIFVDQNLVDLQRLLSLYMTRSRCRF